MREICSYGSARGVPGNRHSYRNYVANFIVWQSEICSSTGTYA